jgi:LysR family transcriptional regulator, regulator of abg operon
MKFHQLQALVAVVDHGGIRAAARELFLSQAAVTKALRLLEEECAVPLLIRRSRGVDLTPAGERLLQRARLVVRQVELARDDLRQAAGGDEGVIRVGITPYVTLTALAPAYQWFRQRYRHVQVQLIDGLMSRCLPRLRDGALDLALVAADAGELKDNEFTRQHVLTASQCIAVREGHPVLANPTAQALLEYEWVHTARIVDEPGNRLAAMFKAAGVELPQRVSHMETLAALALLRHTDAVSVIPEPLLGHPESRGLVQVPTQQLFPCQIDLTLLSQPDVPLTPAAEYFSHCLLESVRGMGK